MNFTKLKEAEQKFMDDYPEGFESPEMVKISKKHKVEKISEFTREAFAKDKFKDTDSIITSMIQLVNKSSMVSLFEKPKFRDAVKAFSEVEKEMLAKALFEMIHGDQESGFNYMVDILKEVKLAKWTIVSLFMSY